MLIDNGIVWSSFAVILAGLAGTVGLIWRRVERRVEQAVQIEDCKSCKAEGESNLEKLALSTDRKFSIIFAKLTAVGESVARIEGKIEKL